MKIGDPVRLIAVTFRGRKETQRYGEYGLIEAFKGEKWVRVTAAGGRWVRRRGDKNFVVVTDED